MKLQIQVSSLIQKNHSILSLLSMFEDYDENDFDEVFIRLGYNRAKELINLFLKLKTRVSNSVFETEVFSLYMCIKDACLINLLYFDDAKGHNCFDCVCLLLINNAKV